MRKGGQNVCERLRNGEHCLTIGQCVSATFDRPTEAKAFENDSVFALDIVVSEFDIMRKAPPKKHGQVHRTRLYSGACIRRIEYKIKCDTIERKHEDVWRPRAASDYPSTYRSALRCLLVLAKGLSTY